MSQAINSNAWTAAQIAGSNLGIDPSILYGQFAGETGNFTNSGSQNFNYAGIQSPGHTSFSSPYDFASYFTSLIERNYPNAIGSGNSVTDYVNGLTNGRIGTYYAGLNPQGQQETASQYIAMIQANEPAAGTPSSTYSSPSTTASHPTPAQSGGFLSWIQSRIGDMGIIVLGGALVVGALVISNRETIVKIGEAAAA